MYLGKNEDVCKKMFGLFLMTGRIKIQVFSSCIMIIRN
jgi:hypothetical protein